MKVSFNGVSMKLSSVTQTVTETAAESLLDRASHVETLHRRNIEQVIFFVTLLTGLLIIQRKVVVVYHFLS